MSTHEETPDEGAGEEQAEDLMQSMVAAYGKTSGTPTGTYESQLTPEQVEVLDLFVTWLKEEDPKGVKTDNTANSYKSYVAQAIVMFRDGKTRDDLTTDQRSGVNAFSRFLAATGRA